MKLLFAIFQQTVFSLRKTTWITCSQLQISTKTLLWFSENVAIRWCDHQSGGLSQHSEKHVEHCASSWNRTYRVPLSGECWRCKPWLPRSLSRNPIEHPGTGFPITLTNSLGVREQLFHDLLRTFRKKHNDPNFLHPTMLGWHLSDQHWFAMILAKTSAQDVQRESSQEWIVFVPTAQASRSVDVNFDWHETPALNFRTLSEMVKNRNWCWWLRAVHRVVLNCCSRLRLFFRSFCFTVFTV